MDVFDKDFGNKYLWQERCKDINRLTRLKWCLIKLWAKRKEVNQQQILIEVKQYYEERENF